MQRGRPGFALLQRPLSQLLRIWRDRRAVSAVEFALLLPFMLVLFIAGSEVSQSIAIYRKVAQTAYTMGDLITQYQTTTVAASTVSTDVSLADVFAAASSVMLPYSASGAQMVLSGLTTTNNGSSYIVTWSKASGTGATPWTKGSAPPSAIANAIPTGLVSATVAAPQMLIVAQVKYTYTTGFTSFLQSIWGGSTITLGDVVYLRPRVSTTIPCADC
jgi:Flp pilus assembly protein TadG